jgi:hypothetical protein
MAPLHTADLPFELGGEIRVEYLPRSDDVTPTIFYVWWRTLDLAPVMTREEINELALRLPS